MVSHHVALYRAIAFAIDRHAGQTRRFMTTPYVHHCLRVASLVYQCEGHPSMRVTAAQVAAVLHDVIEDTPTTLEELSTVVPADVARIVDVLTKWWPASTPPHVVATCKRVYYDRICQTPGAALVKVCDRIDNMRDAGHLLDDPENRHHVHAWLSAYAVKTRAEFPAVLDACQNGRAMDLFTEVRAAFDAALHSTAPGSSGYTLNFVSFTTRQEVYMMLRTTGDVGVVVGRFQAHKLHSAHTSLLDFVVHRHKHAIVVLGLSRVRVSHRNPLDFEARRRMLLEAYPTLTVLYLLDERSDQVWSQKLDRLLEDVVSPAQSVCLYGGRDCFIDRYHGKHRTEALEPPSYISGSELRKDISSSPARGTEDFRAGVIWAASNGYPHVFPTVDVAIYRDTPHEAGLAREWLVVRKPGEAAWRFVGGFVQPTDANLEAAARRETQEETGASVSGLEYVASLLVDDWRYRAEADKILTTLFLAAYQFGAIQPADERRRGAVGRGPGPDPGPARRGASAVALRPAHAEGVMRDNAILMSDSYKLSHHAMLPDDTTGIYSYLEARRGGVYDRVVWTGLQPILKRYLEGVRVTDEDIREAEAVCAAHFSHERLNTEGWRRVVDVHGGRLPVRICAAPEGLVVPCGEVLMTIENTDPHLPWITNHLESILLKAWYPTTVATRSWHLRVYLLNALRQTGGEAAIDYMLQDFGYRGASSEETAAAGAAAHLLSFNGSDTMTAIRWAREYYGAPIGCAASVPGSEHSVMTSEGPDGEHARALHIIANHEGQILSLVADSYDYYAFVKMCIKNADVVRRYGVSLVIRPDSCTRAHPSPESLVVWTLEALAAGLGTVPSATGYKIVPFKVLWGDGIDEGGIQNIVEATMQAGFAVQNLVFGMGGGLLQKVNRDTCRFAIKCSARQVTDGTWRSVRKQPLDASKSSKPGRMQLQYMQGTFVTTPEEGVPPGAGLLQPVFENGVILRQQSWADVQGRVRAMAAYQAPLVRESVIL